MRVSDHGEYFCIGTNPYGTNSTSFNLTVLSELLQTLSFMTRKAWIVTLLSVFLAEPELFVNQDVYHHAIPMQLGSNGTLLCPFKNFDHFEWFKNSEVFVSGNSESADITIHNISVADEGIGNACHWVDFCGIFLEDWAEIIYFLISQTLIGNYTVRVGNDAGEKDFTYDVIVYLPPFFQNATVHNRTVFKAIESTVFTNNCDIDAIPDPKVCSLFWFRYLFSTNPIQSDPKERWLTICRLSGGTIRNYFPKVKC